LHIKRQISRIVVNIWLQQWLPWDVVLGIATCDVVKRKATAGKAKL